MTDENYIAYIKEAQQGKLGCFNGKHIFCEKGKIIAQGTQESMNALYNQIDSSDKKIIHVDLRHANSVSLE